MQSEKPRIHVKTKNLQVVFDYCIETKTEFTVIPRNSSDDWEIELTIRTIKDAIYWGMFLKTNKIELVDTSILLNPTPISKTTTPTSTKNRKEKQPKPFSEQTLSINHGAENIMLNTKTSSVESETKQIESLIDLQNQTNDELF